MIYELKREEIDEISIALQERIRKLKKDLKETHSEEAYQVISEMLRAAISAQETTTYYGQNTELIYQSREDEY